MSNRKMPSDFGVLATTCDPSLSGFCSRSLGFKWLSSMPVFLLSTFYFLLLVTTGCKKSDQSAQPVADHQQSTNNNQPAASSSLDTRHSPLVTLHWLGTDRLATDWTATNFMAIWNLPESQRLAAQTLDKIALAISGESGKQKVESRNEQTESGTNQPSTFNIQSSTNQNPSTPQTNQSLLSTIDTPRSTLLRPLLDDLVHHETYVEVRPRDQGTKGPTDQGTNGPLTTDHGLLTTDGFNAVLVVRLDAARARFWETNLAALGKETGDRRQETGAGAAAEVQSSKFKVQSSKFGLWNISFTRVADWEVVEATQNTNNDGLQAIAARIQRDGVPYTKSPTNYWLGVSAAPLDLLKALHLQPLAFSLQPSNFSLLPSSFSLTLAGNGTNVLTRAKLDFPQPLPFEIEPWTMPTNLIHGPLHSFTAIQGLRPYLSVFKFWSDLGVDSPNQLFLWAQEPAPFLTYAAAPMPGASNIVRLLVERWVPIWNEQLGPGYVTGKLEWFSNENTLRWAYLPLSAPFVRAELDNRTEFLLGGFVAGNVTNLPPPAPVVREFMMQTNLALYDREITGPRTLAWLFIGQTFRSIGFKAQLPAESAGNAWVRSLWQKLGNSTTMVLKIGPAQLALARDSTIGLTSDEIHLLADWLESPHFPKGLHTFEVPGPYKPGTPKPPRQEPPPK
jgi:hypothetical protein